MYAKVNNGQVEQYPYTLSDLRAEYPNTSFPQPFDQETLDSYGIVEVQTSSVPVPTYKQNVTEGAPELVEGIWKQTWVVTDKPAEEVLVIAKALRAEAYRNESDPIFFEYQRSERTMQDWLDKIAEIKARYPEGANP